MNPSSILENGNGETVAVNVKEIAIVPLPMHENGNGNAGIKRDQLRKILHVAKSVRQGDLSMRFPVEEDGLPSEISEVLNDILELNENMINEFARVSVIVGQEGKLTERASIGPVKGAWATGMESINSLISNLVQPTNEFARVITSVARGDLSQKMPLEIGGRQLKGEYL